MAHGIERKKAYGEEEHDMFYYFDDKKNIVRWSM